MMQYACDVLIKQPMIDVRVVFSGISEEPKIIRWRVDRVNVMDMVTHVIR